MTDKLKQAMHFLKIEQELRSDAQQKLSEASAEIARLKSALTMKDDAINEAVQRLLNFHDDPVFLERMCDIVSATKETTSAWKNEVRATALIAAAIRFEIDDEPFRIGDEHHTYAVRLRTMANKLLTGSVVQNERISKT